MLTIEWFEGPRDALDDLFALADGSRAAVLGYRELGRVLVARDGPATIGQLQLIPGETEGEAEVKSLAVREDRQGEGVGRLLMNHAIAICREEGISTILLSTSPADARVLHFYQRLGFRLLRVVRDVFTPEAGYADVAIDGFRSATRSGCRSRSRSAVRRRRAGEATCSCAWPVIPNAWTSWCGSTGTASA